MKVAHASTNYFKVFDIKTVNGVAITSYTSVVANLLNGSSRAALSGASSLAMTAVSGESNSYEITAPNTVSFSGVDTVIWQAIITCVVAGSTVVRTIESNAFAPTRD